MRHYTATKARENFFKILEYVKNGEPVFIERNGTILKLVKDNRKTKTKHKQFNYRTIIHTNVDEADLWCWDWKPNQEIKPKTKKV